MQYHDPQIDLPQWVYDGMLCKCVVTKEITLRCPRNRVSHFCSWPPWSSVGICCPYRRLRLGLVCVNNNHQKTYKSRIFRLGRRREHTTWFLKAIFQINVRWKIFLSSLLGGLKRPKEQTIFILIGQLVQPAIKYMRHVRLKTLPPNVFTDLFQRDNNWSLSFAQTHTKTSELTFVIPLLAEARDIAETWFVKKKKKIVWWLFYIYI